MIPFAAGHEIVRQKKRDLTIIRMTPDVIYDMLIGSGCVNKIIFSWGGNPGVGRLHRLRNAVEKDWPQPIQPRSDAMHVVERWRRPDFDHLEHVNVQGLV